MKNRLKLGIISMALREPFWKCIFWGSNFEAVNLLQNADLNGKKVEYPKL